MIARREEEIRKFIPKEYYGIYAETEDVKWTWRDEKNKSFRNFSKEKAQEIQNKTEHSVLEVTKAEKKEKKSMAPGLYDLTTLQREANQKYGFSAKETLNIVQRLYENHKVLTYPRTDSRYIGKDIVPTIKERLKSLWNWSLQETGRSASGKAPSGQMQVLWMTKGQRPSCNYSYRAVCSAGSYDK